jgi:hypothetical protein
MGRLDPPLPPFYFKSFLLNLFCRRALESPAPNKKRGETIPGFSSFSFSRDLLPQIAASLPAS